MHLRSSAVKSRFTFQDGVTRPFPWLVAVSERELVIGTRVIFPAACLAPGNNLTSIHFLFLSACNSSPTNLDAALQKASTETATVTRVGINSRTNA